MGVSCRSIMKMAAASIAVCALTWAAPALAAPQNGWVESGGERYWYDDGVMARDKQVRPGLARVVLVRRGRHHGS